MVSTAGAGGRSNSKPYCAGLLAMTTAGLARGGSLDSYEGKDFQVLKDVATNVDPYAQFTIFDDVSATLSAIKAKKLRTAIPATDFIITHHGVGYRFDPSPATDPG